MGNIIESYKTRIYQDIGIYLDNYSVSSISLDTNNSIWVVAVSREWEKACHFPYQREAAFDYRVLHQENQKIQTIELREIPFGFYRVQPILGDKILFCNSRAFKHPDNSRELNARIIDFNGRLVREFLLGDSIEDVQVTSRDIIWTSYFDEGIFGDAIAAPGIRSWTDDGHPLFSYNAPGGHYICDCYAMNVVSDDEVWFYYYTEFNLAKIQNNQVEMISTDIQGSDGFVKHGSYFLFRGGYNFQNLYYLYELTNTGLKEKLQIIFTDELNNLIVAEKIHCRGSFLLIQNRTQLFKFDLREILNKHKIQ